VWLEFVLDGLQSVRELLGATTISDLRLEFD